MSNLTPAEIRDIIRSELDRARRIADGDRWVDGCFNCGSPTHGTRRQCPYPSFGCRCKERRTSRIELETQMVFRIECDVCHSSVENREPKERY